MFCFDWGGDRVGVNGLGVIGVRVVWRGGQADNETGDSGRHATTGLPEKIGYQKFANGLN